MWSHFKNELPIGILVVTTIKVWWLFEGPDFIHQCPNVTEMSTAPHPPAQSKEM